MNYLLAASKLLHSEKICSAPTLEKIDSLICKAQLPESVDTVAWKRFSDSDCLTMITQRACANVANEEFIEDISDLLGKVVQWTKDSYKMVVETSFLPIVNACLKDDKCSTQLVPIVECFTLCESPRFDTGDKWLKSANACFQQLFARCIDAIILHKFQGDISLVSMDAILKIVEIYDLNNVQWDDKSARMTVKAIRKMFENKSCRNESFRAKCTIHSHCVDFFDDYRTQITFYRLLLIFFGTHIMPKSPFPRDLLTPLRKSVDDCFVAFVESFDDKIKEFCLEHDESERHEIEKMIANEIERHVCKINLFKGQVSSFENVKAFKALAIQGDQKGDEVIAFKIPPELHVGKNCIQTGISDETFYIRQDWLFSASVSTSQNLSGTSKLVLAPSTTQICVTFTANESDKTEWVVPYVTSSEGPLSGRGSFRIWFDLGTNGKAEQAAAFLNRLLPVSNKPVFATTGYMPVPTSKTKKLPSRIPSSTGLLTHTPSAPSQPTKSTNQKLNQQKKRTTNRGGGVTHMANDESKIDTDVISEPQKPKRSQKASSKQGTERRVAEERDMIRQDENDEYEMQKRAAASRLNALLHASQKTSSPQNKNTSESKICRKKSGEQGIAKNPIQQNPPTRKSSRRTAKKPSYVDRGSSAEEDFCENTEDKDSDAHAPKARKKNTSHNGSSKRKTLRPAPIIIPSAADANDRKRPPPPPKGIHSNTRVFKGVREIAETQNIDEEEDKSLMEMEIIMSDPGCSSGMSQDGEEPMFVDTHVHKKKPKPIQKTKKPQKSKQKQKSEDKSLMEMEIIMSDPDSSSDMSQSEEEPMCVDTPVNKKKPKPIQKTKKPQKSKKKTISGKQNPRRHELLKIIPSPSAFSSSSESECESLPQPSPPRKPEPKSNKKSKKASTRVISKLVENITAAESESDYDDVPFNFVELNMDSESEIKVKKTKPKKRQSTVLKENSNLSTAKKTLRKPSKSAVDTSHGIFGDKIRKNKKRNDIVVKEPKGYDDSLSYAVDEMSEVDDDDGHVDQDVGNDSDFHVSPLSELDSSGDAIERMISSSIVAMKKKGEGQSTMYAKKLEQQKNKNISKERAKIMKLVDTLAAEIETKTCRQKKRFETEVQKLNTQRKHFELKVKESTRKAVTLMTKLDETKTELSQTIKSAAAFRDEMDRLTLVTQNLEEQICGKENTKNGLLTVYEADMKKFGQTIAEKKRKFSEFLSHENRRERKFMKTHEKNRAQKQQKLMAHVMTMVNEAFQ